MTATHFKTPGEVIFIVGRRGALEADSADLSGIDEEDISPRETALRYFENLEGESLERLGVDIVEGEHPGSSYYAAELTIPVEDANEIAEELGLGIRFVAEEDWTGSAGISESLMQAYRETKYFVSAEPQFILKIGEHSKELAALHRHHKVNCSAFVTASNPRSQSLIEEENQVRCAELRKSLEAQGLTVIEGYGKHPTGDWPSEASLLILGLDLKPARRIGKVWEQNAIVWMGADAVPRLILL